MKTAFILFILLTNQQGNVLSEMSFELNTPEFEMCDDQGFYNTQQLNKTLKKRGITAIYKCEEKEVYE
jgi:hypothetical protein